MAFSTHDIVPDSPTNNFCTLNPLGISTATLSDGNLKAQQTNAAYGGVYFSTFSIPKIGKYYIECLLVSVQGNQIFGLYNTDTTKRFIYDVYYSNGSGRYYTDGTVGTPSTGGLSSGTIIAIYIDSDSLTANFFINNNILSSPSYSLTPDTDYFLTFNGNNSGVSIYNFGQDPTFAGNKNTPATVNINGTNVTGPFAPSGDAAGTAGLFYYPPPAGAKALCTANLPDFTPTVTGDVPQDYFKAVTYTGNGTSQSITGVGFQPDFVWSKSMLHGDSHALIDAVRGGDTALYSNATVEENAYAADTATITFDSDGFSFTEGGLLNNRSGGSFVAWCWKAGGAPTADNTATSGAMTANSVSLNGTLQSNYTPAGSPTIYPTRMSINTDAGFSIVKVTKSAAIYSYDTYPHGLSKAPDFIISKSLNASENWYCFHRSITPNNNYSARIQLNQPNQATLNSSIWGTPTNITDNIIAYDGHQYETIFYCWHSVEGYSKFGSYTGNGSADGPMVYCGFRPAFVMLKRTDASGFSWGIYDNKRPEYNEVNEYLLANSSLGTQSNNNMLDFLSNGIKMTTSDGGNNATNGTYIYAAFAEQPFKFSNAR